MTELSCNFGAGIHSPTLGRSVSEFEAPYGIPYDYITPDVFGERYGGGRLPPGTRGYTWTNWQGWLSPGDSAEQQAQEDAIVKKFQVDEMKAAVVTLGLVGMAVGILYLYDKHRKD